LMTSQPGVPPQSTRLHAGRRFVAANKGAERWLAALA
jgi:hypothetical protein